MWRLQSTIKPALTGNKISVSQKYQKFNTKATQKGLGFHLELDGASGKETKIQEDTQAVLDAARNKTKVVLPQPQYKCTKLRWNYWHLNFEGTALKIGASKGNELHTTMAVAHCPTSERGDLELFYHPDCIRTYEATAKGIQQGVLQNLCRELVFQKPKTPLVTLQPVDYPAGRRARSDRRTFGFCGVRIGRTPDDADQPEGRVGFSAETYNDGGFVVWGSECDGVQFTSLAPPAPVRVDKKSYKTCPYGTIELNTLSRKS